MFKSQLTALITTLCTSFGLSAPTQAEGFEGRVSDEAIAHPNYAISAGYIRGDAAPVTFTFGPVSKNDDTPVAPDAPWHIGSITKSMTTGIILRLVERGDLSLDEPVGSYLPQERGEMHPEWQTLTLRELLSHSAGLQPNAPEAAFDMRGSHDLHALRREVLAMRWSDAPGGVRGEFNYSNQGYLLAGYIAETVTEQSWETLIRAEIATPLGLDTLGFGAPSGEGVPWGHENHLLFKRPVSPDPPWADNPPWIGPAGTVHMSVAEVLRWGQAQLTACKGTPGAYLNAALCREAQTEVTKNYGLGWAVLQTAQGTPLIMHAGSNTKWLAILALFPEEDLVVVVATNVAAQKRIDALMRDLQALAPR